MLRTNKTAAISKATKLSLYKSAPWHGKLPAIYIFVKNMRKHYPSTAAKTCHNAFVESVIGNLCLFIPKADFSSSASMPVLLKRLITMSGLANYSDGRLKLMNLQTLQSARVQNHNNQLPMGRYHRKMYGCAALIRKQKNTFFNRLSSCAFSENNQFASDKEPYTSPRLKLCFF